MTVKSYVYLGWSLKPKSIIACREALMSLARDVELGRAGPEVTVTAIRAIAESTKRKTPISVAPKRIRPLDEHQRKHVRIFKRDHPNMSQLELAKHFNTNPGRISEALNEFRT